MIILRNGEWVNEPDEEPQKGPRKRIPTAAQVAASRANGAKSIGPTTDTGRERVKFNSVRHGAACKEIVFLPGEDEAAFWDKVDRTVRQEGAVGELEIEAIKNALYSRVTKERAINAQAIAVTEARARIEENDGEQKLAEVTNLTKEIRRVPNVTVKKLMNSTRGCAFLIRELTGISEQLFEFATFNTIHRRYCLQLTGHRPEDLFTDPVVRKLNRAFLGTIGGPDRVSKETAANILKYECPEDMCMAEFTELMAPLAEDLPTEEQGLAWLEKYVDDHIEHLKERKKLMGDREQRALNAALGAAQAPCDRESVTRDRYINQSDRTFTTAVRVLLALKQERRKHGDESPDDQDDDSESTAADQGHPGPDTASRGEEMSVSADVIPASDEETPSGPETTQAVVPAAGNNADQPASAAAIGPAPLISAEDHAAIMARRKKTMEFIRRQLNESLGIEPPGPSERG